MTWINVISPIVSLILAIITLWGHVTSPVKKNKQRLDMIEARLCQLEADVLAKCTTDLAALEKMYNDIVGGKTAVIVDVTP